MNLVWRKQPEIQLWLIGDPSKAVRKLASQESRVKLLGYVPENEILNYVSNFDIAVYPRQEDVGGRHSIKLVQYMACGIPIVATNVNESYLIRESKTGFITDSAEGFAAAIIELANTPALRLSLGNNGPIFAKSFSWDFLAEKYENEVFVPILQRLNKK